MCLRLLRCGLCQKLTHAAFGAAFLQAFAEATESKVRRVGELQAAVREAALDEGRRRELQGAIQAHFREWLVASGNMRQILELANRF